MKRYRWLAFGLLLMSGPTAIAQDKKGDEDKTQEVVPQSPFETLKAEFNAIQKEFMTQRVALGKEYEATKDDDARKAVIEKMQLLQSEVESKQAAVGKKIKDLADQAEPGDEALEMFVWLIGNVSGDEEIRSFALDKLVANYLSSEKMLVVIPVLGRGMPSESNQNALIKISEVGATDEIKATALIAMAEMANSSRDMAKMYADAGEGAINGLPDGMASFLKKSAEITDEHIEGLYLKAAENFADVKYATSTIGEFVAKRLKAFEMQKNLRVGKVAPDIEGLDIDGTTFQLSDYRGKVVMLDFWGHW